MTAIGRWFLRSLAIAVSVAIFYLATTLDGGWFGTAIAYLIAASASGWLTATVGWYTRSRRPKTSAGPDTRIDADTSSTESPRGHQIPWTGLATGPGERPAASEPIEDASLLVPIRHAHDPDPPLEQRSNDAKSVPVAADAVLRVQNSNGGRFPSTTEHLSTNEEPPPASAELPRVPLLQGVPSTANKPTNKDADDDAKRLAEVLNLYERIGFSSDEHIERTPNYAFQVDRIPGERGLWDELVEEYGAATIDLRRVGSGHCRITLSSGNLVLYIPERRCWVWVAFDRAVPTPPSDEVSSAHALTNPG